MYARNRFVDDICVVMTMGHQAELVWAMGPDKDTVFPERSDPLIQRAAGLLDTNVDHVRIHGLQVDRQARYLGNRLGQASSQNMVFAQTIETAGSTCCWPSWSNHTWVGSEANSSTITRPRRGPWHASATRTRRSRNVSSCTWTASKSVTDTTS